MSRDGAMKRDVSYMIELLREIEEDENDFKLYPRSYGNDGKLHHHLSLLCDEEMVEEINENAYRITKWGHDFLDNLNKGRLERIMDEMKDEFGNTPLEIISSMGMKMLKSKFGL